MWYKNNRVLFEILKGISRAHTNTRARTHTHTHTTQVENLFYAFSNRADPDKAVLARFTLFAHWNMIDLIIH